MDDSTIEHLQELLRMHRERLHRRELQAAQYGLNCPPEITAEIDQARQQITALEQQLRDRVEQASVVHAEHNGWTLETDRQLEDIQRLISEVQEAVPHEPHDLTTPEGFGPRLLKELLLYFLLLKTYPLPPKEPAPADLRCFNQSKIMNQLRFAPQSAYVVELSGPSGIGKTHVLQALQREEDRERLAVSSERWGSWKYVYLDSGGGFDELMTKLIRELAPDYRPSGSPTRDLAQCLSSLHNAGINHVLFVLDNADAIDEATLLRLADDEGPVGRGVRSRLRGVRITLRLVVVARRPRYARLLAQRPDIRIHTLQMDALDLASVQDMLDERVPPGRRSDLDETIALMAEMIYEITGGHPGAIEIILRTSPHSLFTLLPDEYYDLFRQIVLNIVHRDIIGNLQIKEYLLLNILSIFRELHVGIVWDLLQIGLLPSNLVAEADLSDERALWRWLDDLVATSALIRRNQRTALFPFSVHPVLQRVLPLALAAHSPPLLRQLHLFAHQVYDQRLRATDPQGIYLTLSFPLRPSYSIEALYHYVQSCLVAPAEASDDAAQKLVALAEAYSDRFRESYQVLPAWSGRDPFALYSAWEQDDELRKLLRRLEGGDAVAARIEELFAGVWPARAQ